MRFRLVMTPTERRRRARMLSIRDAEPAPEPRLLTPDGEVLPADRDGLGRWQKAWSAEFERIDREPTDVMAAMVEHAPAAKAAFSDRPETVAWIAAFVEKCKGRVAA